MSIITPPFLHVSLPALGCHTTLWSRTSSPVAAWRLFAPASSERPDLSGCPHAPMHDCPGQGIMSAAVPVGHRFRQALSKTKRRMKQWISRSKSTLWHKLTDLGRIRSVWNSFFFLNSLKLNCRVNGKTLLRVTYLEPLSSQKSITICLESQTLKSLSIVICPGLGASVH